MATVAPHTVFRFVHDTLTVVVHNTVRDTLSQFIERVPGLLRVKIEDSPSTWLVPLAAALLGAWFGGWQSRKASKEAIREQWVLERRHALERMLKRVVSTLRRMRDQTEDIGNLSNTRPFPTYVTEGLEVIWSLYYDVAEPIFALKDPDLSDRIDALFRKAHIEAESMKKLELRAQEIEEKQKDKMGAVQQGYMYDETAHERAQVQGQRQDAIKCLVAMGREAGELLERAKELKPEDLA